MYAEATDAGVDGFETEVARGEVELFVVGGIVGDVHLAIFAGDRAVALKDHGSVVVEPRCAALEEGSDEHYGVAACEFAEKLGRRTGNGFGEVEKFGVFCLTEIGRVVQFLQHHEFGSALRGGGNVFGESVAVCVGSGTQGIWMRATFIVRRVFSGEKEWETEHVRRFSRNERLHGDIAS